MLGIGQQQKRFDLLFLEEGEQYIKDFYGPVKFFDVKNMEYREANAFIHFCSRSIVLEIENEQSQPIYKYLFKYFALEPSFQGNSKLPLKITASKIVEVPAQNICKPYKYHQFDMRSTETYQISINVQYQSIETLYKSIFKLYELFKTKNSFHYEQDLDKLFFQNSEFFSNNTFDKTRIKSISEKTVLHKDYKVKQVIPMVQIDGMLYLTNKRIYFQPCNSIYSKPVVNFKIKNITELFVRRYKLLNIGMEFVTNKRESLYVTFPSKEERDQFYDALRKLVNDTCITTERSVVDYTQMWRSFQDITQYPVFPWVLQDYKSDVLDLNDPKFYRDLSKPIGALNEKRLKEFIIRYNECPEGEKYLYGTHYSCPGYVIGFLVRQHPQWMIKFQGGKFDNPNRLFKGINKEWDSVNTNPGNVKELIPEFYMEDPDFLVNKLKLDFGVRSNGKRVDDAKLPNWAHSAEDFLQKNRQALESEYVSNHLHLWIDLIFGCKQRSIDDFNLFHPLTYEGSVDFEKLTDPVQRIAFEVQITEFGQTPRQLFRKTHPQKYSKFIPKTLTATQESIVSTATTVIQDHEEQKLESKFKQIVEDELNENTNQSPKKQQQIQQQKSQQEDINEVKKSAFRELSEFQNKIVEKVHKDAITSLHLIYEEETQSQKIVTTSMDGFIKMIDARDGQTKKAFFVCQSGINTSTALSSQDSFADKLISCSSDQTLRIWDLKGSNFSNPVILYDHEEEIVSAAVTQNILSSMDIEGTIITRDLRTQEIISTIRLDKQYETGQIDSRQRARSKCDKCCSR
eukprot:403362173